MSRRVLSKSEQKSIRDKRNQNKKEILSLIESMSDEELDENLESILKIVLEKFQMTYQHALNGKSFERIKLSLIRKTSFLDKYRNRGFSPKLMTRVYYVINTKSEIIRCQSPNCRNVPNNEYLKDISPVHPQNFFHCDTFCAQQNPVVIEKIQSAKEENHTTTKDLVQRQKERCKAKYGVESYFQTEEFKASRLQTWESHGYDHPMHSDEIKKKMGDRLEEQYGPGIRSNWQIPAVQEKLKKNNQTKYGVDYPMQSKELHDIMHQNSNETKMRQYYNDVVLNFNTADPVFSENDYINADRTNIKNPPYFKWRCKKCGREFIQRLWLYEQPRCLVCDPLLYDSTTSKFEKEVYEEIVKSNALGYVIAYEQMENWSTLRNRKQLDVICFRDNDPIIAFEMNGIYWHQKSFKGKTYHLDKTIECEKLGIKLVHIWEDEWVNHREDVIKLIQYVMTHDEVSDEFIYSNEERQFVSRDKFNRCWNFSGYDLICESDPVKQKRIADDRSFDVYDCGRLILKKQ